VSAETPSFLADAMLGKLARWLSQVLGELGLAVDPARWGFGSPPPDGLDARRIRGYA
jgi:hypothetical protein